MTPVSGGQTGAQYGGSTPISTGHLPPATPTTPTHSPS